MGRTSRGVGASVADRIRLVGPVEVDEDVPEGIVRVYLDIPIGDAERCLRLIRSLYMRWGRPVAAVLAAVAAVAHADLDHDGVVSAMVWAAPYGADAWAAFAPLAS